MPNARARRRDLASDASKTDDSERAAAKLRPQQRASIPTPGAHRGERVGQVTNEREQRSEEQLGDGDRVPRRRVDDGDAERGRLGDVDVVDADAGAPDDLQAARLAEKLARQSRRASPDDGVVVADLVEQVVPWSRRSLVDRESGLLPEKLDAFRVDVVGDEDGESLHRVIEKKKSGQAVSSGHS